MATFTQTNNSGQEVFRSGVATVSFTPGAGAHGALDAIGAAATVVIKGAAGRMVKLLGYRFSMGTTTPVTTTWVLYMYNATPAVLNDNDVYVVVTADGAKFLGTVAMAQVLDFTDTWLESQGLIAGQYIQMPAGDTLTCYLQAVSAITTQAIAHTVTLFYEIQP